MSDFLKGEHANSPRMNWSGNYCYSAETVLEPASVVEVQEAIRAAKQVRALGTRHCFNGIADSPEVQISTARLGGVEVDRKEGTVRVGAGVRYGELARALDAEGFALHNLASLPHISVAGAVATGTHGSGLRNGNLATAVQGLEMVGGDGQVRRLERALDGERFAGAVVGLGALGIVTHLTLAIEPRYEMAQAVYRDLPFGVLEEGLADVLGAGYSVSLFTDWQSSRANSVWIKDRVREGGAAAPAESFHGALLSREKLHPIPEHPAEACTDQGGESGPWYERLPHFRMEFTPSSGKELQSEYFVPIEHGYAALRAVERLRDRITPLLLISELRAVAGDDLWMSMAYRRTSLAIHFTWRLEEEKVLALLPEIEAALRPFEVRPHWGKIFTLSKEEIAKTYPRIGGFRALMHEFDPDGRFSNAFIREYLSE